MRISLNPRHCLESAAYRRGIITMPQPAEWSRVDGDNGRLTGFWEEINHHGEPSMP
jgi:hypothetical protein